MIRQITKDWPKKAKRNITLPINQIIANFFKNMALLSEWQRLIMWVRV